MKAVNSREFHNLGECLFCLQRAHAHSHKNGICLSFSEVAIQILKAGIGRVFKTNNAIELISLISADRNIRDLTIEDARFTLAGSGTYSLGNLQRTLLTSVVWGIFDSDQHLLLTMRTLFNIAQSKAVRRESPPISAGCGSSSGAPSNAWLKSIHREPKTKGHLKELMHRLFEKAMLWELLPYDRNPMDLVTIKGVSKRSRKPIVLTVAQIESVELALRQAK